MARVIIAHDKASTEPQNLSSPAICSTGESDAYVLLFTSPNRRSDLAWVSSVRFVNIVRLVVEHTEIRSAISLLPSQQILIAPVPLQTLPNLPKSSACQLRDLQQIPEMLGTEPWNEPHNRRHPHPLRVAPPESRPARSART